MLKYTRTSHDSFRLGLGGTGNGTGNNVSWSLPLSQTSDWQCELFFGTH